MPSVRWFADADEAEKSRHHAILPDDDLAADARSAGGGGEWIAGQAARPAVAGAAMAPMPPTPPAALEKLKQKPRPPARPATLSIAVPVMVGAEPAAPPAVEETKPLLLARPRSLPLPPGTEMREPSDVAAPLPPIAPEAGVPPAPMVTVWLEPIAEAVSSALA